MDRKGKVAKRDREHWRIQNFPEGSANHKGGRQPIIWLKMSKNLPESENILVQRGARVLAPLDSPLEWSTLKHNGVALFWRQSQRVHLFTICAEYARPFWSRLSCSSKLGRMALLAFLSTLYNELLGVTSGCHTCWLLGSCFGRYSIRIHTIGGSRRRKRRPPPVKISSFSWSFSLRLTFSLDCVLSPHFKKRILLC